MPAYQSQSCAKSHVGNVRKSNQDAYVCLEEAGVWAVADGMGGHEAGELASSIIAEKLETIGDCADLEGLRVAVVEALELANSELVGMADRFTPGLAAGSTVAVLLIHDDEGMVLWAGDSRLYRLREGHLVQLTRDHSHVQTLIDEKVIQPEDAESHPMAHLITRAVGFNEPLALQSSRLSVQPGDRYLLCSDGLNRVLPDPIIKQHLHAPEIEIAAGSLLTETLEAGAPDNVTIVVVETSK